MSPRYLSVPGVVRELLGTRLDGELSDLADRLAERLQGSGDFILVSWYFLKRWLPLLGHDAAMWVLVLRNLCYFNDATGEVRDEVWIEGGYEAIAERLGLANPRLAATWFPAAIERGRPKEKLTARSQAELERQQRFQELLGLFVQLTGSAAFQAAIQRRENLEVLLAPESSLEYMAILEKAGQGSEASIYRLLVDSEDGRYAAIVLDAPSSEDLWMVNSIIFANIALLVARPTLADLAAVRHTLTLLLSGLKSEKRPAREAIHLVLNQAGEHSGFTPRGFQEELSKTLGWAPPVAAVVPFDPAVPQAQDNGIPPVTRGDEFARGIRAIIQTVFPNLGDTIHQQQESRSILRLPKIKFT